ncbi:sulfonate ABC transporter substrate-binding protein [Lichenicoccus roseus]|uniref:Putative aliphatic sulfonates-binding protein n=1 Tax=Lichenicoccus roseus TaxID=2683649 RepID=A0A5R9JGY6_9PROT|nr:sulfonate ABC transporter substrate-binding protein [Lichenicoccus roseus]
MSGAPVPRPVSSVGRRALLGAALGAGLSAPFVRSARAAGGRTIRVGYQRYGTLIILKHTGYLEQALARSGDRVEWSEHPAGPQMLQAMGSGALDFGITGDTPPIFAQAASSRIVYVAHEPPAPQGEAIIVPKGSPITSVAGLKGKSVALNRGSNVHWLLLRALQHAGLTSADINPVYLPPAAGRPAFDTGRVDAWAIWDPYLSSVEVGSSPRLLTTAQGLVQNRQFLLADRAFTTAHPDLVQETLRQLDRSDRWAQAHKENVSQYLAADTGLPLDVVRRAINRLSFGVSPMTPDVVAEQQQIADTFAAQHLIPGRLDVSKAIWHAPA